MKKFIRIVSICLVVMYCFFISGNFVNAASNIYFSGLYQKMEEYDEGYADYYILDMQQYSSPEGSKKGNFTLQEESDFRTCLASF